MLSKPAGMQASNIQDEWAPHFIKHSASQVSMPIASRAAEVLRPQPGPPHGCLYPPQIVSHQMIDIGELYLQICCSIPHLHSAKKQALYLA